MEREIQTEAADRIINAAGVIEPNMYSVVMYNDDVTPMDYVVDVLEAVFNKPRTEASSVMMRIHTEGQGLAGVYTFDIASTKKERTDRLSAEKGYPLRLAVLPE
ncbi:MAG: ATP-dependent Clp protease adaptor ClpS [Defluviitaleaceae bacterium]|nr:ATP-dependent Clp protease adaptor ClpS [Defluviitaleaceae bacterium]